ncbi:MAG: hypothetical protein RLY50_1035, partial [Actinomycetota bacterium]
VAMDYQPAGEEASIVERQCDGALDRAFVASAVDMVRRTRSHPDLRVGSSVRGAVDFAKVACSLADLRGTSLADADTSLDAALVALSGRVRVREGSMRTSEDIVTEIWREVFGRTTDGESGEGKATAPTRGTTSR